MKNLKYLFLFLIISNSGYSQTIINAERLIDGADSTIYAISISYNGTRGNSSTDQLDISPAFILIKKKNDYKLFGGYSLLSNSGKGILNSGFVHVRHNYTLSERFKTFEFYQLQFNDVLLLNKREVFGAGLRFNAIQKDSLNLDFELGLMREVENLNKTKLLPDEKSLLKSFRITFLNSFKWKIGKQVKLNNVIYFQPNITEFNDYRLLNDLNIIVSITERLEFISSLTLRYDNIPPGTLKKLDDVVSFGLNIKFKK